MVTQIGSNSRQGALVTEWVVAMGILTVVMLPLAFSFIEESKLCRAYYFKAVAMEIVDGEMEKLAAGEWRVRQTGTQDYDVSCASAAILPPGRFRLTVSENALRLEWLPKARGQGGGVAREVRLK